ncbi:hypothetical protein [Stenotrophomonas bentonitica]|jgi:hypothetical protein
MDALVGGFGAIVVLIAALLALVVCVLWIFVPFAVFGIKPILTDIRNELRRANTLAEEAKNVPPPVQRTDVQPLP